MTIDRRRIYIVPSRFGLALALLLMAMLLGGLNYNSNLGLAFGFLMMSLALVAMHHCHRNLLGLHVDFERDIDLFAGRPASLSVLLRNDSRVPRVDIELRSAGCSILQSVLAREACRANLPFSLPRRGVVRIDRLEVRTRHPFGWFRAWTYVQTPLTAYVAPSPQGDRPLPCTVLSPGDGGEAATNGNEDFAGLLAYQPGMSLKHMAWKVVARGAPPAVRSYSGPAARPEWMDWALLERLDDEARLSQLCRWVLDSDAANTPYGLRLPKTEIEPARGPHHLTACLRALAAYPVAQHSDNR